MRTVALVVRPINFGWSVEDTEGHELARYLGPGSRRRAVRHATGHRVAPSRWMHPLGRTV